MKKQLVTVISVALLTVSASAQSNLVTAQNNTAKFIKEKLSVMAVTGTPTQKLSLNWNTSMYDTISRTLYTYDGNGNETVSLEQDTMGTGYVNYSKTESYYDAVNTNLVDSTIIFNWNTGSNAWVFFGKYIATWTSFNLLDQYDVYFGSTLYFQLDFQYDSNDDILATVSKQYGQYQDSTVMTVDGNGNVLTATKYSFKIGVGWQLKTMTTSTYDANDNELTTLDESWNGTGYDNEVNTVYTYDANNNELTNTLSFWDGSVFEDWFLTSTFYKNGTELNYQTDQTWDGSTWVNSKKYIWNNNVVLTGVSKALANISLFNVFPNPTSDNANILFSTSSTGNVRLTVLDATGKEVSVLVNGNMQAGLHTLSTSGLAKGMYFVNLQNGNKQSTQKLIIE